jgi:mannan endo-1,4-beta-mannosidase
MVNPSGTDLAATTTPTIVSQPAATSLRPRITIALPSPWALFADHGPTRLLPVRPDAAGEGRCAAMTLVPALPSHAAPMPNSRITPQVENQEPGSGAGRCDQGTFHQASSSDREKSNTNTTQRLMRVGRKAVGAVMVGVLGGVGMFAVGVLGVGAARAATAPVATLGVWVHAEDSGSYSTVAGQHPNIANYYLAWGQAFPRVFIEHAEAAGATPFVEIEPWHAGPSWNKTPSMVDIGGNDARDCGSSGASSCAAWLASIGRDVKAFGHPVIFTFAHEFNVSGQYPWSAGDSERTTPAQWIQAWDTVQGDIDGNGAGRYASWMWVPNADTGGTTRPFAAWWPGAQHVDMVGVDGYPGWGNNTFGQVFGRSFAEMKALTGLPIFIAETDLASETGSDGTQTVTQFVRAALADGASGLLVYQDGSPDMSSRQWSELDAALAGQGGRAGSGGGSPRCTIVNCVVLKVVRAGWWRGRLTLDITGLPRGDRIRLTVRYRTRQSHSFTLGPGWSSVRTRRPTEVILRAYRGTRQHGPAVILHRL